MTRDAFEAMLAAFGGAVAARDGAALAALFTEDGVYDDPLFGAHAGREAIAAMLERFHVGGEDFFWTFDEVLVHGDLGYASYAFSYRSREPESAGRTVVFEGMARFRLRDGRIAHYGEQCDRGVAFAQLGYAPERIGRLAARFARAATDTPAVLRHLAARGAR